MARNWIPLTEAMERPDLATDERFATQFDRFQNNDALMAEFYGWAATVKKHDIYAKAAETRAPISYVHTMQDILESPQYNARGFLQPIEHPVAGEATYPGPPWWIGPDGWSAGRAPLLGEHTVEVLCDFAGMSAQEIAGVTAEVTS